MTVGELRAKMADMPQDAPVFMTEASVIGEDVPLEMVEVSRLGHDKWVVFVS